jgi:hypothetical protein
MLEQIKQFFLSVQSFIKTYSKTIVIYFVYMVVSLITILFILYLNDALSPKIANLIFPKGDNSNNLLSLFFSGNLLYVFYIFFQLKFDFISLIYNSFLVLFDANSFLNFDQTLFSINSFFQKQGSKDITLFYHNVISENLFSYYFFENYYFNGKFFRIVVASFNLPIFFYFGLLFVFTTIFSLFLLSYYGFYGVFLINLVSIILF